MQNVFQLRSINKLLILSLALLLVGCSSFERVSHNNIHDQVAKVQLTGEGRGRVSVDSSRYLFDFGSLAQKTTIQGKALKSWILELDFALHGSEHLIFKWEKERWSVGGSFLGGLRQFIKSSRETDISESELNELLSFISEAVRLVLSVQQDNLMPKCLAQGVCPIPKRKMLLKWSSQDQGNLRVDSVSLISKKNMAYSLSFSNLKSDNYKLLSLKVVSDQGFTNGKELLSLNLYFD